MEDDECTMSSTTMKREGGEDGGVSKAYLRDGIPAQASVAFVGLDGLGHVVGGVEGCVKRVDFGYVPLVTRARLQVLGQLARIQGRLENA
eukprot:evm.model.NODE_16729_length_6257_cov_28.676363.5